ncbi:hypothetical protein LTR62_007451 [Meristemomyces frigidus]|uniref:Uncharacterized protein n=1 Tax=Meristemomyces frigidus TaxID=1508187 RepID=A0AAN7TVJ5_9PEZI|nr:hypothetical protein LTR62_007451 [Meristemomyces frigidus]
MEEMKERLGSMGADMDRWDDELPISTNLFRIWETDRTHTHDKDRNLAGPTAANEAASLHPLLLHLREPRPETSPLLLLQDQIQRIFTQGPVKAKHIFFLLSSAANPDDAHKYDDIPLELRCRQLNWDSSKAAATLVALLACPCTRALEALKFQSRSLGGLPTFAEMKSTTSTSFLAAHRRARLAAREGWGARRSEGGAGVGCGYGLDEYLARGGAKLRSWDEGGTFADRVEKSATHKGAWDVKRNNFYKYCFGIDISTLRGPDGAARPVTPKYEAWVRTMAFEDVKAVDILKGFG